MVKIGHAVADERGKANSGTAGDQNTKEVRIDKWYNGTWHTVLRCKDAEKAERIARECETACANKNIGYDQYQRNTLRVQAKKVNWNLEKITQPCECDCSSLMAVCAECAGIEIMYSATNAPTTSTMCKVFAASGEFETLSASKYLTSDKYLKRGDILVKKGHTVMVLENGENAAEKKITIEVPLLQNGSTGGAVRALQHILNSAGYSCGDADGDFGSKTLAAVKKLQREKGLTADGKVGKETWAALLV